MRTKIGDVYGYLTVLSQAPSVLIGKNSAPRIKINTLCKCGKEFIVSERSLHENSSCGCVKLRLRGKRSLAGQKFNRWTVISMSDMLAGNGSPYCYCVCSCGNTGLVERSNLTSGSSESCGCLRNETLKTHGKSDSPTYTVWTGMTKRGRSTDLENYEDVTVCDRWTEPGKGFENFLEDMGEKPEGCSINRIRGAKIYSKENCEWANRSIQGYDQKLRHDNKTGRAGVAESPLNNRGFRSTIGYNNRKICLGDYDTFEEAVTVRREAELKYFGFTKD